MSHVGPAYGSLAANQAKIAAKRDPNLDREAQEWIETIIGENFPSGSYEDALKDGILLCKLMNKLQPGSIPKFATSGGAFKLRENIAVFQNAARAYGLSDSELFQTIDLFEKRNIPQVTQCIFALGRNAQKKKFNGPTLGPKMSDSNARDFTEEQLRAGQSSLGLLNEGMSKGVQTVSDNVLSMASSSYQAENSEKLEKNLSQPCRTETISASSECSDSSSIFDDHSRSTNRHRRLPQRTLSSASITNLLNNLQNIQLPSSSNIHSPKDNEDDNDYHSLQLLIDLARDTDSSKINKLQNLHSFIEDSIGMVELLSLFRFIKSSSTSVNIHESPLNLYSTILPVLCALFLLENDI